MLTLVVSKCEMSPAATVRLRREAHDAALLRLIGERAIEADAHDVFRTGVELGMALRAAQRSAADPQERYVVDVLASGAVRIQRGLEVRVETSPQGAAEYLLRRLLGPEAVRSFAFDLGEDIAASGHWEIDREGLVEWVGRQE